MAANDPSTQQRDVVTAISPTFLSMGVSERYMYTLGLSLDVLLEKHNQAMRAHMPTLCDPTCLAQIGLDRVLSQGPREGNASFRLRLQTAFETWQRAGTRRAVMGQVVTYVNGDASFTTHIPQCVIVSSSASNTYSRWSTYYTDSVRTSPPVDRINAPGNWNWDGDYIWWRCWLILFPTDFTTDGTWGDGSIWGEDPGSWGMTIEPEYFTQLRQLVRLWKTRNAWYLWFIVSFNPGTGSTGDDFAPTSAAGSGNPDGTWGRWGTVVDGVYVQSRNTNARYVDGTTTYELAYAPTGT